MRQFCTTFIPAAAWLALLTSAGQTVAIAQSNGNAQSDGNGDVAISGELKQWHKVTLTLDGPHAAETDATPNPFTDYRMMVTFAHESGELRYRVPGYFAADGNAGETSAESGVKWRTHLCPDKPGKWTYRIAFVKGKDAALNRGGEIEQLAPYHGKRGSFTIGDTDKSGRDFRAQGRLQYVGKRYLQFAGSGEYFLKAGADSPETLLAYKDFDGTTTAKAPLKTYQAHLRDWSDGDPTWKGDKGKGLIGACNYLAGKGCNSISFLPYNAGGDGENVWPFVARDDKMHYDCSKLDQWQIVFDHAQSLGLYLHFKMQEQENDDNRVGHELKSGDVPASLDNGDLGRQRKLYCRELVARFGYELALNWNLGEENTQSAKQQRAMVRYLHAMDPYDHHVVVHTFPQQQDAVYNKLLGEASGLTGASLQNEWDQAHRRTLQWINASREAGWPWVCANDEQGPADLGVPADPGYEGFSGTAGEGNKAYDLHDIRKHTLWGNLMAGGAGVEYYFGYKLPQNDLACEDLRSRDRSWDYCRIALEFFHDNEIPNVEMESADALVGNPKSDNSKFCFAKAGEIYLVYLPSGGSSELDLSGASGAFSVAWFNPREGGALAAGSTATVNGGGRVDLGQAPADPKEDWLVIVRK